MTRDGDPAPDFAPEIKPPPVAEPDLWEGDQA